MAAPFFSTPFQPYVYQSPQAAVMPFQILGGEAQIVQIMLKPQEKVIAKPGSMCYTSGSVLVENIYTPENEGGIWQWLFGRNIKSIVLLNSGPHNGFVGIAAPSLARIIPGILRQRLVGQGLAFIVAGGSVVQKKLDVEEVLVVDVSCIVAMTRTVDFQIKYSGPMRRVVFGGENLLTAVLTGPGIVFVQSLPFHRLSQRIAKAVTSPSMRENPKFFIQIAVFFFLAYVMIVSSLILTDV
ncbi:Mitochondrial biogenesis protein AIM24 [Cinnamomum micranthum f. kanehirae]|uniref:Mitochondrial biogenesis protein AIM24 n=1 Tax=Cinnamomum micranthum f. kanehirae TaxID=337451 RepID=A0A443P695_9MAGN|nr:Mitochondrial biogenesis protein AIM24 [Cinnamomum micranthum f. kanehirae]